MATGSHWTGDASAIAATLRAERAMRVPQRSDAKKKDTAQKIVGWLADHLGADRLRAGHHIARTVAVHGAGSSVRTTMGHPKLILLDAKLPVSGRKSDNS